MCTLVVAFREYSPPVGKILIAVISFYEEPIIKVFLSQFLVMVAVIGHTSGLLICTFCSEGDNLVLGECTLLESDLKTFI